MVDVRIPIVGTPFPTAADRPTAAHLNLVAALLVVVAVSPFCEADGVLEEPCTGR
jgi:hypothetical protein